MVLTRGRLNAGRRRGHRELSNHLVGGGHQYLRDFQAGHLGGFQIDHHFVLRRRLYRKLCRFLAFEDTVNVAGCVPKSVEEIRPKGDQTAAGDNRRAKYTASWYLAVNEMFNSRWKFANELDVDQSRFKLLPKIIFCARACGS
jgi:hypothetical protein